MRHWIVVPVVLALLATGCGDDGSDATATDTEAGAEPVRLVTADRLPPDDAEAAPAGRAITAFGTELYTAVATEAGDDENAVVSPASVAIALAMLEPGTVGPGQAELRDLLRIDDPAAFHSAMNALEQGLEGRPDAVARIANATYLQAGFPFEAAYLDTIGRHYGPTLHEVDYGSDPDAVAHEINRFVAEATRDRIPELIADGVLDPSTVLTLVNALHLKAAWQQPFTEALTANDDFTLADGSAVTVPFMHGRTDATVEGDGWLAATKALVDGLSVQFVLPDEGRFTDVEADLASVFDEATAGGSAGELALPRFESRFGAELTPPLQALGLHDVFEQGSLLGIADDDRLAVGQVIHETWVAMDEGGVEAAAATAVAIELRSAPVDRAPPVVLDRPFLFRIFDGDTGATLFLGRVMDPS